MTNIQHNITGKNKILLICCVMLVSALTAGWTLSGRPLNNHECFVSITAREMLQSGDWVWPTCNGQPRLNKTPLPYWLVAGLAKITGRVDEFTARLPSAIFAVLLTAAILYYVSQWLGLRIAGLSALIWATSLSFTRFANNARPDMVLTFFVSFCFLSFYSAITATTRKKQVIQMLLFWTSFALANLAKGPVPLPLVLLPLFFYILILRRWKQIPGLLPIIGTVIFLAIFLPWPLAIAHKMDWNLSLWKTEFLDRFLGSPASGNKPLYYYLPKMFLFTLPWAAFVPYALAAPFYTVWGRKRGVMQFLWLWFVIDLVFLTISAGKRQHYIMPAIPALCILAGILLEDMVFVQQAFNPVFAKKFLKAHIIVLLTVSTVALAYLVLIAVGRTSLEQTSGEGVGYLFKKITWCESIHNLPLMFLSKSIIFIVIQILTIVITAVLFAKGKKTPALGAIFAGITILTMISYVFFINPLNYNLPSKQFTQIVAQKVPISDKLVAYKSASNRFVHYFGRVVPEISEKPDINQMYNNGWWIVAFGTYLDDLLKDGPAAGGEFKIVFLQENAERHKQNFVAGALIHK